ncbi:MAG: acetyl-CoA hydrolase/transferase C-terminal domain-containing protein, partial [Dehalococcoidia bacterium]|nr:acetyl-CoA hydrolase/transferase C-terminal domain-containing protein [Dehalococcoidia bacterium]
VEKAIAAYLSDLVRDGDTICIGFGNPSGSAVRLGAFDNKIDLGYHGEMATRGLAKLVEKGVITGKHKPLHKGKAVVSAWLGLWEDEMDYINGNPLFEAYETNYMLDVKTLISLDNFVAINNSLSIDLTGQINSESVLGPRLMNGMGGQAELSIGSVLAGHGRSVNCMPSTALGGAVSRIVPMLEEGSLVTIPRYLADHVVTEYGVARLFGKTIRQRAEELIAIAHPDFRGELKAQAKKLFYC